MARQPEPVHRSSALRHFFRVLDPRRQLFAQQFGDEGARHDHALVDIEAVLAEPGLVGQIGGGHALLDAALDHRLHRFGFAVR